MTAWSIALPPLIPEIARFCVSLHADFLPISCLDRTFSQAHSFPQMGDIPHLNVVITERAG